MTDTPSIGPVHVSPTVVEDALALAVDAITRRSFLTGEFWTPIVGGAVSLAVARFGFPGDEATQIVAEVTPALVGLVVGALRHLHKRSLVTFAEEAARLLHL